MGRIFVRQQIVCIINNFLTPHLMTKKNTLSELIDHAIKNDGVILELNKRIEEIATRSPLAGKLVDGCVHFGLSDEAKNSIKKIEREILIRIDQITTYYKQPNHQNQQR